MSHAIIAVYKFKGSDTCHWMNSTEKVSNKRSAAIEQLKAFSEKHGNCSASLVWVRKDHSEIEILKIKGCAIDA